MCTALILLPVIEFSWSWGKVIGTFAQTSIAIQHGISIPFSQVIFISYTPIEAMVLSFVNSCLVSFMLGLLMFLLNLRFTRSTGMIGASTLILWQMSVNKTWTGFIKYSPVSWVSLDNIDVSSTTLYPDYKYVLSVLLIAIIVLTYLSVRCMKRKDIQVLKAV